MNLYSEGEISDDGVDVITPEEKQAAICHDSSNCFYHWGGLLGYIAILDSAAGHINQ